MPPVDTGTSSLTCAQSQSKPNRQKNKDIQSKSLTCVKKPSSDFCKWPPGTRETRSKRQHARLCDNVRTKKDPTELTKKQKRCPPQQRDFIRFMRHTKNRRDARRRDHVVDQRSNQLSVPETLTCPEGQNGKALAHSLFGEMLAPCRKTILWKPLCEPVPIENGTVLNLKSKCDSWKNQHCGPACCFSCLLLLVA